MVDQILRQVFLNQGIVVLVTSVVLLTSAELGFRFGLRLHRVNDEARKGQIGGIQGAMLGLLGLLLGFTFAMAVGRYDARRALVLSEANAIGTTYLRADLLPEPRQEPVRTLLRRYVDMRLDFYAAGDDNPRQLEAERKAARVQHELWTHAVAAGREAPSPIVPMFIQALNETIDLDAMRLNALRNHVPGAVWLLVLAVAACGCCASGYSAGASGAHNGFTNFILPMLIAVAITLIADLDRPRGGLIGISQRPLLDLKESLQESR